MSSLPVKNLSRASSKGDSLVPVRQGTGVQLSLFDFTPVYRLLCLPMAELHGMAFARVFGHLRPAAVVDVRNHPYFDLTALNRSIAFDIFQSSQSHYFHRPLDLRTPTDQSERWQLRRNAASVLSSLLDVSVYNQGHTYAFLVHHFSEIEVLEQAIRNSELDRSFKWQIERPDVARAYA